MNALPDSRGYFGRFGGRYVPEPLMEALLQLETEYRRIYADARFQQKLNAELHEFAGRPTPLYFAQGLSRLYSREIYLKREDLAHTGAHKINNCVGQALLAHEMGKKRIVAETGAGQHGVATAATCARLGLQCVVYMGAKDMQRQKLNVQRMQLFGAEVRPVHHGSATLKDAINEALRDWITNVESTHYLLGSVVGPHPYPTIVRNFQKIIGEEIAAQLGARKPAAIIACVGGGSNAIGAFHHFLETGTQLIGVEAGGEGERNSATLTHGHTGILHGAFTFVLQHSDGQIRESTSIAPGLDYSAVGPEHSYLKEAGLVRYVTVSDSEARDAFHLACQTEGIVPALESCHAIAYLKKLPPVDGPVIVNLSGRGDKDLHIVLEDRGSKMEHSSSREVLGRRGALEQGSRGEEGQRSAGELQWSAGVHAGIVGRRPPAGTPQFFPYLLANYPTPTLFEAALHLTAQYAQTIEIGLPFTDPVADGPVIQQASASVLGNGFDLDSFFGTLRNAKVSVPVAVMTYANVMHARGREQFCSDCREAGVASLIVPDVPYEESAEWRKLVNHHSLQWISFLSLTTSPQRLAKIARESEGFLYLLALTGVTGSQILSPERILKKVSEIRESTTTPVALGFGIKSAKDTKPFAGKIDASIVGSKIVEVLRSEMPVDRLKEFYEVFTSL